MDQLPDWLLSSIPKQGSWWWHNFVQAQQFYMECILFNMELCVCTHFETNMELCVCTHFETNMELCVCTHFETNMQLCLYTFWDTPFKYLWVCLATSYSHIFGGVYWCEQLSLFQYTCVHILYLWCFLTRHAKASFLFFFLLVYCTSPLGYEMWKTAGLK